MRVARVFVASAACLWLLTGCESWNKTVASFGAGSSGQAASASGPPPPSAETTGSIAVGAEFAAAAQPEDPDDDLNLGKRHFRESQYGLAERHFRRAGPEPSA